MYEKTHTSFLLFLFSSLDKRHINRYTEDPGVLMIFKTVNSKVSKASYDAEIKNIDLSTGHWGSEKKVFDFLDHIETLSYTKETFDKNLILHSLGLLKDNIRLDSIRFYRIPEENKIILLAITNVGKLKEPELFTREMSIYLKREKFAFSIVELLKDEYTQVEKGEKTIPENWKFDEKLTDRISKLRHYQF